MSTSPVSTRRESMFEPAPQEPLVPVPWPIHGA
jgi:hypothetical protein